MAKRITTSAEKKRKDLVDCIKQITKSEVGPRRSGV